MHFKGVCIVYLQKKDLVIFMYWVQTTTIGWNRSYRFGYTTDVVRHLEQDVHVCWPASLESCLYKLVESCLLLRNGIFIALSGIHDMISPLWDLSILVYEILIQRRFSRGGSSCYLLNEMGFCVILSCFGRNFVCHAALLVIPLLINPFE